MSKTLLKEQTIRRFMKLADIEPLASPFVDKIQEAGAKAGRMDRSDIANKVTGRWLKEEEEEVQEENVELRKEEDEEVQEENIELPTDELREDDDELPTDELPPEEELPEEPGAGLEKSIEDFIMGGAAAVGVDIEIGEGAPEEAPPEEAPMENDLEGDLEESPAPAMRDYLEEEDDEDLFEELADKVIARLQTENKKIKKRNRLKKIDVAKLTERVTKRLAEEVKKKTN